MPYYKWAGVDIIGTVKKGKLSAQSEKHLNDVLFKRGIALINHSLVSLPFFKRSIRLSDKIHFFRQLATLVDSGVHITEALSIVADQINHPRFHDIVHAIADSVRRGTSLPHALCSQQLFDPLAIQIIVIGNETGNLCASLEHVVDYLHMQHEVKKEVKKVVMVPLITALFVFVVAGIIFGIIIPRFADLFISMQQEVPKLTQTMIQISNFVYSWQMGLLMFVLFSIGCMVKSFFQNSKGKAIRDQLLIRLPFISTIVRDRSLTYITYSLALLLANGMRIVPALTTIRDAIDNVVFKNYVTILRNEVAGGSSLSEAMMLIPGDIFAPDVIAMIRIGEESGTIDRLLEKVSRVYYEKTKEELRIFTLLLQPLLMVILGLLVAGLIFAVYLPIMSFSQLV